MRALGDQLPDVIGRGDCRNDAVDDGGRSSLDKQIAHIDNKHQTRLAGAEQRMLRAAPAQRPRPVEVARRLGGQLAVEPITLADFIDGAGSEPQDLALHPCLLVERPSAPCRVTIRTAGRHRPAAAYGIPAVIPPPIAHAGGHYSAAAASSPPSISRSCLSRFFRSLASLMQASPASLMVGNHAAIGSTTSRNSC